MRSKHNHQCNKNTNLQNHKEISKHFDVTANSQNRNKTLNGDPLNKKLQIHKNTLSVNSSKNKTISNKHV